MRILVADDSRVMRQIVIRTLRRAGYTDHTFLEAADGASALELARTESPDLVLSDWNMPAPDGLEVLRRLRASGDPVPFGFVTSESSVEMRRRAHAAGAQFVIGKPFDADSFRDALAPVLPAEDPAPAETALPTTKAVRDLFAKLLGRDVTIEPGPPVAVGADDPAYVALYVEDRLRLAATAVTDLALALRCAAALGLAPRTVSDAALRERQLPAALRTDADEVLNVVSTLFNQPGAPHVRLDSTHAPGRRLPADVDQIVHAMGRRLDLVVDIAGYGAGGLSLVLAP